MCERTEILLNLYNQCERDLMQGNPRKGSLVSILNYADIADSVKLIEDFGVAADTLLNWKADIKIKLTDIYKLVNTSNLYEVLLYLKISPAYFAISLLWEMASLGNWKDAILMHSMYERYGETNPTEPFSDSNQNTYNSLVRLVQDYLKPFYQDIL